MGRPTRTVHQTLTEFNALSTEDARDALQECCASTRWAESVAAGRPYEDVDAMTAASDAVIRVLPWSDVAQALAAHPRIGERPPAGEEQSNWSSREQSGVADADADTRNALDAGNAAYERRFGHIYLVRAAGRSAAELASLLQARLGNDDATERAVVRGELADITRRRLVERIAA